MATVVELVLSWLVMNALTFLVIFADERKILSEEQLERAWPPSSRDAAIIAFGPLCLPFHFLRTRVRLTFRGVFLGIPIALGLTMIALAVIVFGSFLLDLVFSLLGFPDTD